MQSSLELDVLFDGDVLRRERCARELRDELERDPELRRAQVTVSLAPRPPATPGATGVVDAALVLPVAGAP